MASILTLQIISADDVLNETSCTFNKEGGSIGRRVTNTWVLPDNQKYLSGQHALISYSDEGYILTDTSMNGVFINHSSYPLGRDNHVTLQDSDIIQMGGYQIKVVLPATSSLNQQTMDEDKDPFAGDSFFKEPKGVDQPVTPEVETVSIKKDDFFDDDFFKSKTDSNVFDDDFFKTPDPVDNDFSPGAQSSFKKENPFDDSFFQESKIEPQKIEQENPANFETKDNVSQDFSSNNDARVTNNPFNTEFFEGSRPILEEENKPLDKHSKSTEQDDFIETTRIEPASLEKAKAKEKNQRNVSQPVEPTVEPEPLVEEAETQIIRPSPGLPVERKNITVEETQQDVVENFEKKEVLAEKNEGSTAAPAVAPTPDALIQFLIGMGIEDPLVQREVAKNMNIEDIGKLFRIAIQGTVDLLRSRTDIKNEMHIDATMIGSMHNNPLKFSISLDDTLVKLMTSQQQVYMTPERALVEAYDDMKGHQVAVLAGMEAILHSILERFRPEMLVQRFEKESPIAANIPLHRQAKLWKRFELLYETIQEEAEEDFNHLLGKSFNKAYEQQVKGLKSAK